MAKENNCRECGERRGITHKRYCPHKGRPVKAEDTNGWDRIKQRPPGYQQLSVRDQYAIDKQLGVLDWEP